MVGWGGGKEILFFFFSLFAPHWPLHAHPEDIAKYKGIYDMGYEAIRKARYQKQLEIGLFDEKTASLSEPEHEVEHFAGKRKEGDEALRMEIHAAMVDRMDQNIGRVVQKLEELEKLKNTLILFLVDNGASHKDRRETKKSGSGVGQCWIL